jgi:hypothetical protein
MGAPTSGLLAEFFLQHLEHIYIPLLSDKHKIARYLRYVDDILIIYDSNLSDLHNILDDFNKIHPKLVFTAEQETDSQLNFLDITIHRTPTEWKFAVYRKPTFTDTIIPYDSNHPNQHKYATVRFLYNRLNTYDLHKDYYKTETTTTQNILHNNCFPIHPPTPRPSPNTNKKLTSNTRTQISTPKWATFTYIGKETNFITNLFKKTNIKIAFRTNNSIQTLLSHRQQKTEIYSQSGVYKLTCPDCGKAYVRQTGRNFATRFREHRNAFSTASQSSNFAKHLIEHSQSFGPIHNTMQILQLQNKGTHLNTVERFYIYAE